VGTPEQVNRHAPPAASNFSGNDTISVTATDTVDNNQASASGVAVPQL
jgi:hypothetical protein